MPRFIKYPLIATYILGRLLLRGAIGKDATLNLAGVLPPPKSIVHGGKVKLLVLRERFGDTWRGFNLAYFVSSGLPFAPSLWIRLYKMFGVKVIWNQNGFAYPALYAPPVVARINDLLKPMHQADFVVFQTEFTKRCAEKFLGSYAGPSEILVNPVDTERFAPRLVPLPQNPFVIIMSGHHFESAERLQISLESVRELRRDGLNAKLIVIANTQTLPTEDWIEVRGRFTQEEAPRLYQEGHILLHLKNLDPCPTLVLEALASGLPVIGLGNGGMPELVDRRSGVLIPATEDFEKFHYPPAGAVAQAIREVKENLDALSRGAREKALQFDKKIWLEKHAAIFAKVLR